MIEYKLYCISGTSKVAGPLQAVEAKSDEEAIRIAKALAEGVTCELWHGAKLIAKLPRS